MKKLKRQVKGILYRLGIHHFIPIKLFYYLAHLGRASEWINRQKDTEFTSYPTMDIKYNHRIKLYAYIIEHEKLEQNPVDYLEFGVHAGNSIRWWAEHLKNSQTRLYGFDTFTGLPEAWGPFDKGHFGGVDIPQIDDDRCHFLQGLFQQTLLPFLANHDHVRKKVIHMDADLYSSTLYVLTLITPYLKKGDIILFDEFNVPISEVKAFREWTESFYIEYDVIGEVNNYFQVAFRMK